MNLLFQTSKPRRFSHTMVYCDERRERLQRLESRARRELGMEPGDLPDVLIPSELKFDSRRVASSRPHLSLLGLAVAGLALVILLACALSWL